MLDTEREQTTVTTQPRHLLVLKTMERKTKVLTFSLVCSMMKDRSRIEDGPRRGESMVRDRPEQEKGRGRLRSSKGKDDRPDVTE